MSRVLSIIVLAFALATPAFAQDADPLAMPLPALKAQLAAGKQTVVAHALALTPAEEADFWPVFDTVQRGLEDIASKRKSAQEAIAAGGDEAESGVEDLVDADGEQADLLERAWSRLRGALPAAKLARYLQLERRIAAAELL